MHIGKIQLDSDEHILLQIRKHWFILAAQILSVVAATLVPLLFWMTMSSLSVFSAVTDLASAHTLVALYTGWLIVSWMTLFSIWTNYYLDVWTITNKRLVTVDQRGLFNRFTGSFRLERLQDINVSVTGVLATFLDYGDLTAETASDDPNFVARGIPNPQDVKALILKAADTITFTSTPLGQTAAAPTQVNDGL